MLYLCCAMVVDVAIFTMGLTMSIIDVNKYNFGLYLVLMSVVAFSLLVALWVAKPKFCRTPPWAIRLYYNTVKSSRSSYHTPAEAQHLMEKQNADDILRSIKGIPLLIQAIQYSLEAAYVPRRRASTTGGQTLTDSAIESAVTTTHDYANVASLPDHSNLQHEMYWIESESENTHRSLEDEEDNEKNVKKVKIECGPWCRKNKSIAESVSTGSTVDPHQTSLEHTEKDSNDQEEYKRRKRRDVYDVKRQSIFVVFPYSETLPIDRDKLQMRRYSSERDLRSHKASFEKFYSAAIAAANGEHKCASTMTVDHGSGHMDSEDNGVTRVKNFLKVEELKKTEARRSSIEVRYVGLQSILLAKMTGKS